MFGGHFMTIFDLFPKYPCFLLVLMLPVVQKAKCDPKIPYGS